MSCAAEEVLMLVHNGFSGMCFVFPPPAAPLLWSPPFLGVLSSELKMSVCGKQSLADLIFFHLTSLSHPDTKAQQLPGVRCTVWGEERQAQPPLRLLS